MAVRSSTRIETRATLKWIAAAAALLALVAGSFELARSLSDVRARKRFIAESLDVAGRQQAGGDYASAWATLEAGSRRADEGGQLLGQLSRERQDLRVAQEELAMRWLRHMNVPAARTLADVVDRLLPVLERGTATTRGIAQADRRAHIGWAYFLKLRDGRAALDPSAQYQLALQSDPDNPYAHAFWGCWMVWSHRPLAQAMAHFEAATRNPANLPYLRSVAIAVLGNRTDDAARAQLVRWVDEMWRNGETVGAEPRRDLYAIYSAIVRAGTLAPAYTQALPPDEHVALLDDLASSAALERDRSNVLRTAQAMFQEQSGDTAAALATWRSLHANAGPAEGTLRARAEASIRRLLASKRGR